MKKSLLGIVLKHYSKNMNWKMVMAVGVFGAVTAAADMYECNGVWTNRPCDAAPGVANRPESIPPELQTAPALEVKASDILEAQSPKTAESHEKPAEQKMSREKRLMVSELRTMNKACRSYYSLGQLRQFERDCLKGSSSISDCHEEWSRLHSEMLGEVRDEKCRNAVFSATNKYDVL